MSGIRSDLALKNTRTTFQRVKDLKLFTGKVREFSHGRISVACVSDTAFEPDSEFAFEVFGNGQDATFTAVYASSKVATLEGPPPEGVVFFNLDVEHWFTLTSEVRLRKSHQEVRYCPRSMAATLSLPGVGTLADATVVDISKGGLAVLAERHLRKGDIIDLVVFSLGKPIFARAEVRYAVRDRTRLGWHRIGMKLLEMDRVSVIRWRQTLLEVIRDSRHDGDVPFAA